MLTKLREPFGKAGLIVAIVALIAALGGGAYAASGGLTGKQKKEVTAIAKKYAGKPGTNGTNGTNGAPGAKGDTGAAGAAGSNGTNGTNGGPGANGKSVEAFEIAKGEAACEGRGGAEYEVEGSGEAAEICNGEPGSPWAVGGLPQGATETGVWAFNASEASAREGKVYVPISFSVPLSAPITDESKVHYVGEGGNGTTCPGTVRVPKALDGELCIYHSEVLGATFLEIIELEFAIENNASKSGAYLGFKEIEDEAFGHGTWAVTGG